MLASLLDYINEYFCSTFLEIICNIFKTCLAGTNKNNAIIIFIKLIIYIIEGYRLLISHIYKFLAD